MAGDKKRKFALIRVWKKLNFKLDSLCERIRLQKTVYILAKMGFDELKAYLPTYGLYLYGPYSAVLAKDAFEIKEKLIKDTSDNLLSKNESKIVKLFSETIESIPVCKDEPTHATYELLGNMIYYSEHERLNADKLFDKIKSKTAYFSDRKKFDVVEKALKEMSLV